MTVFEETGSHSQLVTRDGDHLAAQAVYRTEEMGWYGRVRADFWAFVIGRRIQATTRESRTSERPWAEVLDGLRADWRDWSVVAEAASGAHSRAVVLAGEDCESPAAVFVELGPEGYAAEAAAGSMDRARAILAEVLERIPSTQPRAGVVPVKFWTLAANGPVCRTRMIDAPPWASIRRNYPARTAPALGRLMTTSRPDEDEGKLLLLSGPPGTGKTFAIRAIAQEWRPWCLTHYVVDPDEFFEHAEYMMQVLIDEPAEGATWNLLVLEDCDEFLTVDAKSRVGQSFARLLNLTSGMVGQGLRLLVLLTTNERMEAVHEAVVRPGRCAADVDFVRFPPVEAAEWLLGASSSRPTMPMREERTLAELYALARDAEARDGRKVGFRV